MDTPRDRAIPRNLAVLAALMAFGPLAAGAQPADDWTGLLRQSGESLPPPATVALDPPGAFGQRIAGRGWLMVSTRYRQIRLSVLVRSA